MHGIHGIHGAVHANRRQESLDTNVKHGSHVTLTQLSRRNCRTNVRYTLTSTLYNVPSTRSAVTAQSWCVTNLPRLLLTLSSHRRYLANYRNGCFPSHLRAWNYKTKAYKEENQGCCWVTSTELSICLESKSDRGRSPKHKFVQSSSSIDERYDSQTRRYQ
jgi:hypothetical protein